MNNLLREIICMNICFFFVRNTFVCRKAVRKIKINISVQVDNTHCKGNYNLFDSFRKVE